MGDKSPLGEQTSYEEVYSPDLLYPISREDGRRALGLGADLPFSGEDVWNAWELTWLDSRGKPVVATAEIRVPADSPNIIESKSMKLYLNAISMTLYPDSGDVASTIARDLTKSAGAAVSVASIQDFSLTERETM
jgi:7-cyano-7-deazaguanine reductase